MEMKAAVKQEPKPGITLTNVPVPQAGPNDIILRIGAAAICGSDLHVYNWDETGKAMVKTMPVILGHEFMGEIVEVGDNVNGFNIGERVAVDPGITCGTCMGCRTGQFNLCEHRETIGADRDGGFAQYTLVNPNLLYKISDEVTDEMGAFLEIFALAVHAVEKANIKPGDTALIIGAGPIGLSTLLCARAAGAKEIYITEKHSPIRLKVAEELGPDGVIDVDEVDPVKTFLDMKKGQKADVVFEVSGDPTVIHQAAALTRKGGEIILIGVPPTNNVEIPLRTLVDNEISMIGIRGRNHISWTRAINLIKKVNVGPIIGEAIFSLDDIDDAFKKVKNREVIKGFIKPN
ncbi:zinc-binding dehydrogenase [Thermodesulfobacteriota bacterium]